MITRLRKEQIKQLAKLHKNELSGFLPELGEKFLEMFYRTSLDLPEMFTFIEEEKGKVRGFVSNITNSKGLNKKIFIKRPLRFLLIFLKYFISHPGQLRKFFTILTYPGFKEGGAELLSIAVGRNYRLKGRGRRLFEKSREEFSLRGIKTFKISVYERLPANGFYKKIGCRLVDSFDFMGEKMNYYEYKIKN
ncbi:hypothetical protein A3D78_05050 [Candidatus Gottesmanbacteria bacterium RIFCSPHIGHO2_02_FULL_39_14]|uniref:N-acetyltransferase domain-containing protein n=1 Tax=Candidatus Gottesmanbacteria bacterium RIFCSPHIGHO2_02_FULL_39_14 TaxID=1798383 RepID=A0A1F5ZZL5_9BACT|nr:MAG: hypothetical protein A3D78_05050 [Candidatus Gottesmanbacteria bacterium RIFCSPHIGHO2_02_FULL_39_14]